MNERKPNTYTQNKKLICDWTDKKNYVIHYRMLKFDVGQGMIVDKLHELISFTQIKRLDKQISFNSQKREINQEMILKRTSIIYSIKLFTEKQWKPWKTNKYYLY